MDCDSLADLMSLQLSAPPFIFNTCAATIRFHLIRILSLENILPGQIQRRAVVADIHHFLLHETFSSLSRNASENNATIGNGCFTTRLGWLSTVEPQLHRPII